MFSFAVELSSSFPPETGSDSVRGDSRSNLKAPIQRFEALQGIQQLQAYLAHMNAGFCKLFRVLDRKLDSINGDPSLIGHLEFKLLRASISLLLREIDE